MVLKVKRSATFAKKEKSKGKISEEIQEKAQFEGFKSLASAFLAEKKKYSTCAEALSHQWAHQVTVPSKKIFQL